ncbi:MAG: terminase gpA endonuclease subunit [Pseudomonadota bacterium]
MICGACGCEILERDKPAMLAQGAWLAMAPGGGKTAGFRLSSLYSPWLTWAEIAAEYDKVKADPPRLQVFTNTVLGQAWSQDGETIEADGLLGRREALGDRLPDGVALLTAGVDVQGDRIEISVIGWGAGEEAWVIEHRVIWGDPSGPAIWADLDRALSRTWPHVRSVADLRLHAVAVDTGGHYTAAAYEFCRTRLRRRVWGIKGRGGPGVPLWPRRHSRGKGGAPMFTIGVDAAKDVISSRLRVTEPGPACIHFSADLDEQYFKQLTAERRVTELRKGRPVAAWKPRHPGARNEAFDCAVYALAALYGLRAAGLELDREAAAMRAKPLRTSGVGVPIAPNGPRVTRSRWMDR